MNWLRGLLVVLGGVFEMSEMKPWGYISPSATKTLLDRAQCDLTITRKSTHNITLPLYTADQLAEAVAAERERIAAIWDVKAETALECMKSSGKDGHHFQQIYKSRLEIAEAIRSAAK